MVICYIVDDCKFWYFFYFWRESIIVIFQDKKLFLFMNIFLNYKQFSITISIIILFSFKYWKIINLIDFFFPFLLLFTSLFAQGWFKRTLWHVFMGIYFNYHFYPCFNLVEEIYRKACRQKRQVPLLEF